MKKLITLLTGFMLGFTPSTADAYTHDTVDLRHDWTSRYGLRFGYVYLNKAETTEHFAVNHLSTVGFESQQTLAGGSWLDILFIQNIMVSGLDQSVMAPSLSALVGLEINKKLQLGIGPNVSIADPSKQDHYVHLVTAIGYTMDAGLFSVPIHFSFIPDVEDFYRVGITTGVSW